MKKEEIFSGKTQGKYLSAAKIICFSFLFSIPVAAFAESVVEVPAVSVVQQQGIVKGTVVDEQGETVIGANIKVVGTTVGAITDLNGMFSVNAPVGAKLEISFIGYVTQVVTVPVSRSLKVILKEDSELLDEVVIVGYGTQRVKDLTGAASNVKMEDIPDIPGTSIIDALAGQVIGLSVTQSDGRPGSTGSFKVRQPMSFDADGNSGSFNQPLIVIDDVVQVDENGDPSMTAFNMLNQSEIESMTVLKDASAAVYGSRASAGVILVKTKRGNVGAPKISYSGKLDFADAVSHAKTMNAYELGVFTNRLYNQADMVNGNGNNSYFKYSLAELEAMKNLNYNWLDEAWHSSVSHRHSLTVNGGSEKVTFFAGINYQKQETNLGNVQDYDKWTFRAGGEVKVASGLKLSATLSGYNSNKVGNNAQVNVGAGPWGNQTASRDYAMLSHMPKYIPWETLIYDEVSGETKTYFVSPWGGPQLLDNSTDSKVSGAPVWNYFAEEASKARSYNKTNGYSANFSLTYDVPFIKGLNLKGTYAISYNNSTSEQVGDYYKLARAGNTNKPDMHLLGDYTEWNFINYGDPNGENIDKKPRVKYAKNGSKSEQYSFAISYNRTFGQHDVSATGVVERAESEGDDLSQLYQGLGMSYGGTSATAGTLSSDDTGTYYRKYESGSLSYIGRASYKYANRYLAQFVFRSDASTKFAPENYWGFFPTGSLGWVASEEKFFNNSTLGKIFDFLKVRYSLGKTGKDNVEAWRWLQIYNIKPTGGMGFGSLGGQYTSGASINGTANRNIKWDTTIKQNIGLDMNMLNNRLSVTADFYYDKTKDLIMTISDPEEPIYVGAKLPSINYGKKDAWGFELSVRWSDDIKQSLLPSWGPIKYSIGLDYGISWNKTVLGVEPTFDYPAEAVNRTDYTGYRGMGAEYGFKTWKHTSSGDGILRNQTDIDNYWDYLTKLAEAAGVSPNFLGITSKEKMYPGMLVYEDIAGDIDTENKTIAGPNGVISKEHGEDYAKLADNRRHGINTKLRLQWGNFSWSAQISTTWGGFLDFRGSQTKTSSFMWSQFSYINDMFDMDDNPNGRYPTMAAGNAYGETSDFWQVSAFRMYVRNMTFAYSFPKSILKKVNVDALSINLTGNNLWDFHNPYPDHFVNVYDGIKTGYPTLRTWSLGLNLTF